MILLHFSNSNVYRGNFEKITFELNNFLSKVCPSNVKLVDIDKIISVVGIEKSLNSKYFFSTKMLYTIDFLKEYIKRIKPFAMAAKGRVKKAIIFDCDNTLWGGVLGEDGFNNIEMSPKTKNGIIFSEIQALALSLNRRGVLIGICTE